MSGSIWSLMTFSVISQARLNKPSQPRGPCNQEYHLTMKWSLTQLMNKYTLLSGSFCNNWSDQVPFWMQYIYWTVSCTIVQTEFRWLREKKTLLSMQKRKKKIFKFIKKTTQCSCMSFMCHQNLVNEVDIHAFPMMIKCWKVFFNLLQEIRYKWINKL